MILWLLKGSEDDIFQGQFQFFNKKTKTVSSLENYQTSFCLTDLSNKRISLELTLKWDQIARLNLFRNGQGYIFQNPGVILKIVIQNRPWLFELECGKKRKWKKWNILKKISSKCDTRGGSYQLLRFKWRGALGRPTQSNTGVSWSQQTSSKSPKKKVVPGRGKGKMVKEIIPWVLWTY